MRNAAWHNKRYCPSCSCPRVLGFLDGKTWVIHEFNTHTPENQALLSALLRRPPLTVFAENGRILYGRWPWSALRHATATVSSTRRSCWSVVHILVLQAWVGEKYLEQCTRGQAGVRQSTSSSCTAQPSPSNWVEAGVIPNPCIPRLLAHRPQHPKYHQPFPDFSHKESGGF